MPRNDHRHTCTIKTRKPGSAEHSPPRRDRPAGPFPIVRSTGRPPRGLQEAKRRFPLGQGGPDLRRDPPEIGHRGQFVERNPAEAVRLGPVDHDPRIAVEQENEAHVEMPMFVLTLARAGRNVMPVRIGRSRSARAAPAGPDRSPSPRAPPGKRHRAPKRRRLPHGRRAEATCRVACA